MSAPPSRPSSLDWGLLALLGLVWGGSFLGVELSLHSLSPLWVAAGRISLAALLLVGVALLFGGGLPDLRSPTGRRIWLHALAGLFTNAIPSAFCPGASRSSVPALPGSPWRWCRCSFCRSAMSLCPASG